MKNQPLLPNQFKFIGWILFIPATIAGLYLLSTDIHPAWLRVELPASFMSIANGETLSSTPVNLANTITGILFIIGGLLIVLSKEKHEDEYVAALRLSSLLWAVVANYALLLLAFLLVYDLNFLNVAIYNMFTMLLIFIIHFEFTLYNAKINIQ